jgi:methionyl-tRNA synthetase
MIQRYRGGVVPAGPPVDADDRQAEELLRVAQNAYFTAARNHDFNEALAALWSYLRWLDGYIVKAEPWKLAKDEAHAARLDAVLANLYRALRATALMVAPVMPGLAQNLWDSLGLDGDIARMTFHGFDPFAPAPAPVRDPKPLFARLDKDLEMTALEAAAATDSPAPAAAPALDVPPLREAIDYDTFAKTDLRVGLVLAAEEVPKSKKLIKMTVDLGFEQRTILGGIKEAYAPADLVGKRVVVVANLAPRALMGIESHGMLLAASDNNSKPYLIAPPDDALPGFIVK